MIVLFSCSDVQELYLSRLVDGVYKIDQTCGTLEVTHYFDNIIDAAWAWVALETNIIPTCH